MKVKELIQKLNGCNQDADVYAYSQIDEGGDEASKVMTAQEAKEDLYFKGDAPWYDADDSYDFVVIA